MELACQAASMMHQPGQRLTFQMSMSGSSGMMGGCGVILHTHLRTGARLSIKSTSIICIQWQYPRTYYHQAWKGLSRKYKIQLPSICCAYSFGTLHGFLERAHSKDCMFGSTMNPVYSLHPYGSQHAFISCIWNGSWDLQFITKNQFYRSGQKIIRKEIWEIRERDAMQIEENMEERGEIELLEDKLKHK